MFYATKQILRGKMTDLSTSAESTFHNHAPQRLLRVVTVAAYLTIVAVSLCPAEYRPKTGLIPGPMEHLFAYLVLGLLAAWATRRRLRPLWLVAFNAILAGGLELLQNFSPGRGPSVLDFSASAVGSAIGIAVMTMVLRGLRQDT
ncbi:MAG: VanZ family protein [Hyphomicrobium sp.]